MATGAKVLVVGSLGWDCTIRLSSPLTPGAFIQSQSVQRRPAGTGANLALGLSSAGVSTRLVGSVGTDEEGSLLRDHLVLGRVECEFQILPTKTSHCIILVEPSGERTIVGLTPDLIDLTDVNALDLCNISTVVFPSWRPHFHAVLSAARERACGTVVGLRALADPALPAADLAIGSRHELGDIEDPSPHLSRFDTIVVTEGVAGSRVYQRHRSFTEPALPAEPRDSTGAGDAFMAGFIAQWVQGATAERCALVGAVWGARAVEHEGSEPPPWHEVEWHLAKYRRDDGA